ncbi:MAG: hypothetical protein JKX78_13395 [Alteromonadaceae bacterium]|nr:hypothetical protein [Alteromonadaceae bacterium]
MNKLSLLSLSMISFFSLANDPVSYTLRAQFEQNYYLQQKQLEHEFIEKFKKIRKNVIDPKTKKINRENTQYKNYIIEREQAKRALKARLDPNVQEQRYRDRVSAATINQQRVAMDAELKKATVQRELQLKQQKSVKGSAEFEQTKSVWKKDLKQIRNKYKTQDNRWQNHQQLLTDAKINPQDMGNTGSRPNSIQSDLDLTPKTNEAGLKYVNAYKNANTNSFVEERGDRWIIHDTDTVVWKKPVKKQLGSSSSDSEISFRAQKNSDAFSTTGGLNFTSNGQLGIKDNEGAVLANANKFSDAIDPKHRDLSTAAKSVYKSQDASNRTGDVDPEFRKQLEVAYKDKGTKEEVFDSFGDSVDEKLAKEKDFYQKATQDISSSYQQAEIQTKKEQLARKNLENKLLGVDGELPANTDFSAEYNKMDNKNNYRTIRDVDNNITAYQKIPASHGNASDKAIIALETVSVDDMKKITINKVRQDRVTINAENQATLSTLVDRDASFTHQLTTGKSLVPIIKNGKVIAYKEVGSGKKISISEAKASVKGNSEASLLHQIKNSAVGKTYKGINVIGDLLDIKKAVTKGVNRALDEEQKGDSALKTWAKATGYGVWENSSVKGLLDGGKQVDQNIRNDFDELSKQEKLDRKNGLTPTLADNYLSFLKALGVVGKRSGEFALNMAWGMTVGAVESVGNAIGENLEGLTRGYNIDEKEQYAELVEFKAQKQSYLLSLKNNQIVNEALANSKFTENVDQKNEANNTPVITLNNSDLVTNSTILGNSLTKEGDELFSEMKSTAEINNDHLNKKPLNIEPIKEQSLTVNSDKSAEPSKNEDDAFWDVDTVSTDDGNVDNNAWEVRQQVAEQAQISAKNEENSVAQLQDGIKNTRDQSRREFAQGMQTLVQGVAQVAIKAQQESLAIDQQVAANNANFSNLLNSSNQQKNRLNNCMAQNRSSNPYADINAIRYRCGQQISTSNTQGNSTANAPPNISAIPTSSVQKRATQKVSYATKTYFTVVITETGSVSGTFQTLDKQYATYRYADKKGRRYYSDSSVVAELDGINKYRREGKIQLRSRTESVVLVDNCVVPKDVYQQGVRQMARTKSKLNGNGYQTSRQTWGGADCG